MERRKFLAMVAGAFAVPAMAAAGPPKPSRYWITNKWGGLFFTGFKPAQTTETLAAQFCGQRSDEEFFWCNVVLTKDDLTTSFPWVKGLNQLNASLVRILRTENVGEIPGPLRTKILNAQLTMQSFLDDRCMCRTRKEDEPSWPTTTVDCYDHSGAECEHCGGSGKIRGQARPYCELHHPEGFR